MDGTTLEIAFDETLAPAANLANSAFAVKKTPSGGSEESVALNGSPAISGDTVTLTLDAAVASTDALTVSYDKPASGTANKLEDAAGNEVASFADTTATNNTTAALRAWFQNVPDEHDGSSVFTLQLAFSEAVFEGTESFNKNQAIRDALEVTGGALRGGRRVERNAYDRWLMWIRPSGDGDVTVDLPATTAACGSAGAICTPDGRPLSAPGLGDDPGTGGRSARRPVRAGADGGNDVALGVVDGAGGQRVGDHGLRRRVPQDRRELDRRGPHGHVDHETDRRSHGRHGLRSARARIERRRRGRLVGVRVRPHGPVG